MATPQNDPTELSIGTGIFMIDGATVGLLKDNVIFRHNYDQLEFKEGQPLVLWASATREIICEIEATYAQMNPRNMGLALGGVEATTRDGTTPVVIASGAPQLFTCLTLVGQDKAGFMLDGPTVTSLVVKDSGGNTLVADTDYTLDAATGWVYLKTGGDMEVGGVYSCSYSYVPPAGQEIPLGKTVVLNNNHVVDFLHKRTGDGKMMRFRFWRGQASGQMEYTFAADNWVLNKFVFKAIKDERRPDRPLGSIHWAAAA